MKKILITFLLSIIGFISFSSAFDVVCNHITGTDYDFNCFPQYVDYDPNCNYIISYNDNGCIHTLRTCVGSNYCWNNYYGWQGDDFLSNIQGLTKFGFIYECSDYTSQVYHIRSSCTPLEVSDLSPAISSIFTVTGEIIPYVVYIGIGVLLVTLGFFAIKWFVNWLVNKITKYFK